MSTEVARLSRLEPDVRLAQAVSLFESDLSSEQKATLRAYRSQNESAPPNPSDVMYLTAEIDRRANEGGGSGRCYGPRMTNFLSAVQQFASIGDVMIGGSQNIIACGVWFLVRVSLLSAVKNSSYLEKLSDLLMIAGRSAPRYQKIASLYPRSKNLQAHLAEYFIVVVELCHALFNFTRKSAFGQFTSSLSDAELKAFQSKLEVWANSIKEEMGMLVAQKIEEEARKNTRFRALLRKDAKSISYEQKIKTRLRVLDLCSTYDYETPWKQARKVGNASLFNRAADYQDWKSQANSCTLFYTGKLGSGKSVLLANIVDDLNIYAYSKGIAVTYFFCRSDIPGSLQAQTVTGSLVRQLLRFIPDLTAVAEVLDDSAFVTDFEKLLNLLKRVIPPTFKAYFVLDGLDECDSGEIQTLISRIQKLQETFILLICTSFRLGPGNALESSLEQFIAPRSLSMPDANPDIESFIEKELEICIESGKLEIGDPTLILEIRDALLQKSQGMFLWVALQIKSICAMRTDEAMRQALKDLPRDLSETFARILANSEPADQQYQVRILELIAVAERPLQAEELREALSVVPGNSTWNRSTLLNNIGKTLACCGSLVIVDEEELTVRFVHHSVKQYLLASFETPSSVGTFTTRAHETMGNIIVTYLSYGVFDTKLSKTVVPQIHTRSVPQTIIRSTLDSSSTRRSFALRLLKSTRVPNYDIGRVVEEERKKIDASSIDEFQFYSYAKSYWQHHLFGMLRLEAESDNTLYELLQRIIVTVIDASISNEYNPSILSQAIAQGPSAVITLLIKTGRFNADLKDPKGQALFSRAVEKGHEIVVKLLLEIGTIEADSKDSYNQTPLAYAAENGHETVVKLLLETGRVNADSKDYNDQTPLSHAAKNGYNTVIKLLLETGRVNADSKDYLNRTPLLHAAKNGHEAVVKLLLETGRVNADLKDYKDQTPLLHAAKKGHETVVKLLLKTGTVDIDSIDRFNCTPFYYATHNGYKDIARLLSMDT